MACKVGTGNKVEPKAHVTGGAHGIQSDKDRLQNLENRVNILERVLRIQEKTSRPKSGV